MPTGPDHHSKHPVLQIILIVFLTIVATIVLVSLVYTIYANFSVRHFEMRERMRLAHSLTVSEIQPWMTFGYLNRVFHLPPNYLAEKLKITNPRYPSLSLVGYAHSQNLNVQTLVGQVDSLIQSYRP